MRYQRQALVVLTQFMVLSQALAVVDAAEDVEKHLLQYKFQMGEVLRYGVNHSTNIRTTIEATTQEAESQSESIKAWKVTDVLPNGEIEFVHVVEQVRMSNRVPNRALRKFDSELDKEPPPGFEQAAGAVGIPLSVIRIRPSGEVTNRKEKHPQPAPSKDLPMMPVLPEEPMAVGEEWSFIYDIEVSRQDGTKQKVRTRRVCTLEQVKAGVATFTAEYQILTPVSAAIESQLIDRQTQGKVRFDIERGRIISQKFDADRRVIGFSGDASSMHFVSRMEERLLKPEERLASNPKDAK
ncbi:MAG: hypothetical protein CMJ72_12390 [Planctomycetaceae bacterium]|nr:hypothetical protein [Planctomycetaceae bacterium]HCK42736.1 hypothetical protein [Planctomycetaceae bacterium]